MSTYYTKEHAEHYNQTWRLFSEKTLTITLSLLNSPELRQEANIQARPLRILDAACGTGLLLAQVAQRLPEAELYGVDRSSEMLHQADQLLQGHSRVHLTQASLIDDAKAGLPFEPAFFDLILCTNTLHYLPAPVAILRGLSQMLAPKGHMAIEDYVLRGFPFPWKTFEWAIKIYDPQHVRLYTSSETRMFCQQANLQVIHAQAFPIDLFCQGWALLLKKQEMVR